MAVTIKVKEKEQVNELLGQLVVWGVLAMLIGKLLGFKFNLHSDDKMTQWGFQLGDAFKFSRQKLKNSGISPEIQDRVNTILNGTEVTIKRIVQTEAAAVRSNPSHKITIDRRIMAECDDAVNRIEQLINDRRHAEDLVKPIRHTFDSLNGGLEATRKEAALNALMSDRGFRSSVEASLGPAAARNPALVEAAMRAIADRISASLA